MLRRMMTIAMLVGLGTAGLPPSPQAQEAGGLKLQRSFNTLEAAPRLAVPKGNLTTTTTAPTTAVPLTSGECRGLGGSVVANSHCSKSGMANACKTVDADGVVRVMCIDEVKN